MSAEIGGNTSTGDNELEVQLTPQLVWEAKWFCQLSEKDQILIKGLIDKGYWFEEAQHQQDQVVIQGQKVKIPSLFGFRVSIFKKNEGTWNYIDCFYPLAGGSMLFLKCLD